MRGREVFFFYLKWYYYVLIDGVWKLFGLGVENTILCVRMLCWFIQWHPDMLFSRLFHKQGNFLFAFISNSHWMEVLHVLSPPPSTPPLQFMSKFTELTSSSCLFSYLKLECEIKTLDLSLASLNEYYLCSTIGVYSSLRAKRNWNTMAWGDALPGACQHSEWAQQST